MFNVEKTGLNWNFTVVSPVMECHFPFNFAHVRAIQIAQYIDSSINRALVLIFSPLALADLDASEPTGVNKEASVTEAGRRPVGRRRKGPRITEHGASTLLYFSHRTTNL